MEVPAHRAAVLLLLLLGKYDPFIQNAKTVRCVWNGKSSSMNVRDCVADDMQHEATS